jgi:hypothetical protein
MDAPKISTGTDPELNVDRQARHNQAQILLLSSTSSNLAACADISSVGWFSYRASGGAHP